MKKYNTASPYFAKEDISGILRKFKDLLSGRGLLTMAENVRAFERAFAEYVGVKFAIAANSGTSALEIALKCLGVKEGDEVVVPAQTFIATGSSVLSCGAKAVFCEIDENFLLDFQDLKKKINPRTKAAIIVHFAGLIHPQIFQIKEFLKKKNICLIEDAAHAHGAKIGDYFAGNIGDFGCFSFFSTKIMTTAEGGMITVNNRDYAQRCASLRNRGQDSAAEKEIFTESGSNSRLTEFQAILGVYQLRRLEEFIRHRNRIAGMYLEALAPLERRGILSFPEYPKDFRNAYWKFLISLRGDSPSREAIRERLGESGIKIDWPYQPLLHLQPVFRKAYKIKPGFLKKSEALAKRHFCLPVHMGIKERDALFIAARLKRLFK